VSDINLDALERRIADENEVGNSFALDNGEADALIQRLREAEAELAHRTLGWHADTETIKRQASRIAQLQQVCVAAQVILAYLGDVDDPAPPLVALRAALAAVEQK
jgi:2',3'-cyclic-nucleotide 2'-phosphodiesterase (5'-nucleotidase family)